MHGSGQQAGSEGPGPHLDGVGDGQGTRQDGRNVCGHGAIEGVANDGVRDPSAYAQGEGVDEGPARLGKHGLRGEAGPDRGVGVPRRRRGVIADGVEQDRVHAVGNIRLLGWIGRGKEGHQIGLRIHQRQEAARGGQFEVGVQLVGHRRQVPAGSEHDQVIAGRQHVVGKRPLGQVRGLGGQEPARRDPRRMLVPL